MFGKESFLRKLPVAVSLEQRLQIETLVYAADAVALAYDELQRIARAWGSRVTKIDKHDRTAIFSWVWTIIDEIHVIRQLFRLMLGHTFDQSPANDYQKFCDKYEGVARLRNRMDHLSQNVANLASSKISRPPIFGVLSYLLVQDADVQKVKGKDVLVSASIVTINSGTFTHKHSFQALNPAGRQMKEGPVGLFQFTAFDDVFILDELVQELFDLLKSLEKEIEHASRAAIEKAAHDSGESIEKLLTNAAGDIVIILQIKFSSENISSTQAGNPN